MKGILEVFSVDADTSDSGVNYFRASLRPVTVNEHNQSVFSSGLKGTRTFFEGEEPNVGDRFGGGIYEMKTTEYTIGERTVSKIKFVAFSDETPVDVANKILEKSNACVLKADGTPSKKMRTLTDGVGAED